MIGSDQVDLYNTVIYFTIIKYSIFYRMAVEDTNRRLIFKWQLLS